MPGDVSLKAASEYLFQVSAAAMLSLEFLSVVDSGHEPNPASVVGVGQIEVLPNGVLAVDSCVFSNNSATSQTAAGGASVIVIRFVLRLICVSVFLALIHYAEALEGRLCGSLSFAVYFGEMSRAAPLFAEARSGSKQAILRLLKIANLTPIV